MPPRPFDRTVPAGQTPFRSGIITGPSAGTVSGPLGALLDGLRQLFLDQPVRVIPVPFVYWVAYEIPLLAGDNWIDQMRFLQGRRAWAIVNWNAVATNFVWINSHAMGAVSQGGRVAGVGGSFSAPIGQGANQQEVHVLPLVAGTAISFYQFA